VTVRDTGKGIPPEELDRIFEPFYSTKDFGHGTGLGLAIVKRVMEEHRGTVKVESKVGVGTMVVLSLPAEARSGAAPSPGSGV
jgi:signal transduction histidine kinase